jgi:hypothetical protein
MMDVIDMIEKKIHTDGEPYYFNTETTETYGEIVGGLAWPETTEGFLVIAAVDFFEDNELEARHIRVLEEATESDIDTFLKHALELQKHYSPFMGAIRFYGDTTALAMVELLDQFNRDRRHKGLDPFYLTEAPQLKDPRKNEFYAQLIRKYTQPGRKTLHFCNTALPSYLMGLWPEEISENVLNHTPVAALAYALAVLSTWKPRKREAEVKAKYERVLTDKPTKETIWQFMGRSELPK